MNRTASNNQRTGTGQNIIKITVTKLFILIVALGIQTLLARALGPDGRGTYETCLLFGATIVMLCNLGIETAPVYFVSSGRMSLSEGASSAMTLCALVGLISIIGGLTVLLIAPPALAGFLDKAMPAELMLGLVAAITGLATQTLLGVTTARQQFTAYSTSQAAQRVAAFILTALLVVAAGTAAPGALISIIATDVLLLAGLTYWLRRQEGLRWCPPSMTAIRQLASYGGRFYFGKISNQANFRMAPLVLAVFATRAELGYYGQASAMAIQYMTIPDAVYTVLLPRMSRDALNAGKLTAQVGRIIGYAGGVAIIFSSLFAGPVFRVLFSESFLPAVPVFKILLVAFAFRAYGKSFEPYLIGADRPGAISMAVSAGLAVNIVLLAALYRHFGLIGAAWSLAGNYAISTIVIMIMFSRSSKIKIRDCWIPHAEDLAVLRLRQPAKPRK